MNMKALPVVLLFVCGLWALPVTVVKNATASAQVNTPLTLSLCFCEGEISVPCGARVDDTPASCQWDVKRTWPGGSIKHALLSLSIPSVAAGDSVEVTLDTAAAAEANTPISAASILATDFDAQAIFVKDGQTYTASARELLLAPGGLSKYWCSGPIATEFILRGNPKTSIGVPDSDLCVQFEVRFYQGLSTARVSFVVENTYESRIHDVFYDVTLKTGSASPDSVYGKAGVRHYYCSRWRKDFRWGAAPADLEVRHDIPHLITTGLLERYNLARKVTVAQKNAQTASWASEDRDILQFGKITPYMPMTGGRDDIGPNPGWVARWIICQENWARDIACGTANMAGTYPIHYRESDSVRIISIKKRPNASLNWWCYGQSNSDIKKQIDSCTNPGSQDDSHEPNMVYVPYLLTGDYYYLEELFYWANWNILEKHWAYRQFDKGLYISQVRGDAWGLWRTMAEAAAISPDNEYEKGYFDAIVRYNIAYHDSAKLGTPKDNELGVWRVADMGCSAPQAGDCACFSLDAVNLTSSWMDDFVTMMIDHTVDLGYDEAIPLRDWKVRYPGGRFGDSTEFNPYDGGAYRLATQYKIDSATYVINDWATLHAKSYGKAGCGGASTLDANNEYNFWARGALSAWPRLSTPDSQARKGYDFLNSRMQVNSRLDMEQIVDFVPGPARTVYSGTAVRKSAARFTAGLTLSASPNPFSSGLTITLPEEIERAGYRLSAFDARGRLVSWLTPSRKKVGEPIVWNAGRLPVGIYFLRLEAGGQKLVKRMALVR